MSDTNSCCLLLDNLMYSTYAAQILDDCVKSMVADCSGCRIKSSLNNQHDKCGLFGNASAMEDYISRACGRINERHVSAMFMLAIEHLKPTVLNMEIYSLKYLCRDWRESRFITSDAWFTIVSEMVKGERPINAMTMALKRAVIYRRK